MTYYAHSGRTAQKGRPAVSPHPYADHVRAVIKQAVRSATEMVQYLNDDEQRVSLVNAVEQAARFHDLGKLGKQNNDMLSRTYGEDQPSRLPVNHVDAGVAHLLAEEAYDSALLTWSHHRGLPDRIAETCRHFPFRDAVIREEVDSELTILLDRHFKCVPNDGSRSGGTLPFAAKASLDWRFALSCLVDADHGDTATHFHSERIPEFRPTLRAEERLARLDQFIERLSATAEQCERNSVRASIYQSVRNASANMGVVACDSPVGTGKTLSIMGHLLKVAAVNGLRRIFVVLPFTNIIDQAVAVYREALVLEGEDPEQVVSAHHHRAEFESPESRSLAYLWRAPIVVVTAVQFFETMAAASTGALRKLHEFPGAAVFVDEAHAAMPADLWLPAWGWVRASCERWNCHWVLASGSLTRFWELQPFRSVEDLLGISHVEVPELVSSDVRSKAVSVEKGRVRYESLPQSLGLDDLANLVMDTPGPRVVVMNTVRGAAKLALRLSSILGREAVEHLSTALCPRDRASTLGRVRERLDAGDENWTLVATSCVEAGVDISFRNGFRERFGLCNLLQLGGRVCREARAVGIVYDFVLKAEEVFPHPGAQKPALALKTLVAQGKVGPAYCKEALDMEIKLSGEREECSRGYAIAGLDFNGEFKEVQRRFRIIDSDTRMVVIDRPTVESLQQGRHVSKSTLQDVSVQIWSNQIEKLPVQDVDGYPDLYVWNGAYDEFLGYLAE
ncbi:CRISPR-associated helicase/endonuclease Cas3 [Salidesulfovibrio onnuriiensis]|uniref:CRISPR-associated helicase/endonuclease Cas3 n=1 Tax=Salidesulfovibrio onnuriiensis TaxID=2583823 RepID=UPI0011C7A2CE|nr:CRISPR-associated protein [Salidesulfovibrio onnuriiensis]